MVIKDADVDMDAKVVDGLLALPYSLRVNADGLLVLTPLTRPGLTWEQLATTHLILPEDLAWKVETNGRHEIITSPPPRDEHNDLGVEILFLLRDLLPHGRPFYETGVKTSDGTRVPNVGWTSKPRRGSRRSGPSFSPAPDICVEIISASNTRRQIEENKRLYFEAGALEFWRCELDGTMRFFSPEGPLPASVICPAFPTKLDVFD